MTLSDLHKDGVSHPEGEPLLSQDRFEGIGLAILGLGDALDAPLHHQVRGMGGVF